MSTWTRCEQSRPAARGGGLDEALFSRIPQDQTLRVDEIIQYYDWKQFDIVMQLMSDSKKTATIMHIFPGFLDHAHAPDWMRQLTDDELREWIVKHSETIASHLAQYEIEPAAISVVNELMWHGPDRNNPDQVWLEGNYLYSRLHDEFIQLAYATARQLWPESLLLMNDDSSTEGQQTNTPFNTEAQVEFSYIHRMRQQGVSIDGYGYQGHLLARNFLEGNGSIDENIETNLVVYQQQLTELFQQYHSIGALVYVTELDVNTGGLPADWTTQQKETLKARIYTIVFETALESGACPNITTWSFSNAASWVFYDGYPFGPSESPLPFDEDFKPTQSAFEIRRVLLAHR